MVALLWCAAAVCQKPGSPPREFTNSVGMKFVWIEPGSFQMGSQAGNADEQPVHEVTLSEGFYLQVTEVTQRQWEAVMGSNLSYFKGPDRPVDNVRWEDAQEFLQRLNQKETDDRYRLPTEAEWEYACRARGQKAVCQKKPNAWGLFDMCDNFHEWVQDWYGDYSAGRQIDPTGPAEGALRVVRGGSCCGVVGTVPFVCAGRGFSRPDFRYVYNSFRCARTP
jgi:formylglycine-generating enzyme required for sulfatase activity